MIINATGSILDSAAEAIVIPCNCVGVTGAGLALAASKRWPEAADAYRLACKEKRLWPGQLTTTQEYPCNEGKWIIWLATKDHWRNKSVLDKIAVGCYTLRLEVDEYGWDSIAIPALVCGCGGLRWDDVRPLIESAFADWQGTVHLYAPGSERQ